MKASFRSKKSVCLIIAAVLLMSILPLSRVDAAEPQTDPTRNTIMAGWNKAALIYNNIIYEWNKLSPVPVPAATQYASPNELGFRELDYMVAETGTSLGAASSCYATLSGGVVTVGGSNRYGLRGDGVPYQNNYADPTTNTIAIPANVVQIGVGGYHILALDEDGKVWSWGRNNYGQLGNGEYISSEYDYGLAHGSIRGVQTPTIISALADKTITYIAAGDNCSFAIDSNDNVYTWGYNRVGQLGLGDIANRNVPTINPELSGKHVIKIMGGMSHCIALTAEGRIYAWGDNSLGELGLGYFNIGEPVVKTPTLIEYLTNVKNIGKGTGSCYAVTEDGRYWGWGRNEEKIVDGSGEMISIPVHVFPASIYKSSTSTISEGDAETRYIHVKLVKDPARSFNSIQPQKSDFTFSNGEYKVKRAWKINEYECIIAATYPSANQDINYNIPVTMNGRLFKNNLNRVIPYWGQAPYANQLPGEPVSETDPGIEKWKYMPQRFVEGSPSIMTLEYNINGASFTGGCTPGNIRLGQSLLRGFTIKSATLLDAQRVRLVIEYDGSDNDNINSANGLNINLRDEIPLIFNSSTNSLGKELNTTAFRLFAVDERASLGISSDDLDDSGDYFIPEGAENGRYIIVSLVGSTFKNSINAAAFTFSNLPEGVSIDYSKTVRMDNHNVKFCLQGNRTKDFDLDYINTSVSCPTSEIIEDTSTTLTASTGSFFKALNDSESIAIQNDPETNGGIINEGAEDGGAIRVTLTGGTFANVINKNNWTVTNLPAGVSLGSVQRVDATHVKLILSGNRNGDYDNNITNVAVACTTAEYNDSTSGSNLTATSGVILTASNDAEVLTISNDPDVNGGRIYEGRENGSAIIAAITGGVFSNPVNSAGWTVTNLPAGVSLGSVQRADDTHVKILLSGNRTEDYTGDINNVTVTCGVNQFIDSTGNTALTKDTGVVLRKNPLSIIIGDPAVNIYKNGSGTITITGTFGNTDSTDTTISASVDGKIQSIELPGPGDTWQLEWNIASLAISEGNYKDLIITASDSYGNSKSAVYTGDIVVDTTAPDTTITNSPVNPASSASASFEFASNEGIATFESSIDGAAYSVCSSPFTISGFAEGSHTFSIRAIDAAGNVDPTPAVYSWTVDTTAPDTNITSTPPAKTNSTSASFGFNSNEGSSTFEGSLDGAAYGVCTSPVTFTGLSEGSHTFAVRAIDAAGNVDITPAAYSWTVDATAPDTNITSTPSSTTNSTSASFGFTSDDGLATFEGSLDGAAYSVCTSPTVFTGLSEGSHTFEVRAIDAAGNIDPTPAAYSWTVDSTGPDTTITATPSVITSSTSAVFEFTSDDGLATFEGSLDGAAYSVCTSPLTFTGLAEGSHTFSIRAIDAIGNVDPTPATYSWTVDITAPDTTLTSTPSAITNSTSASFGFTSNEGSSTFESSLDGAAYGVCTSPAAFTGLAEGPHTFSIRAIDAIGNVDPTPATYSWTVDTTAPDTSITSTPSAISNSTSASFGFTSDDGLATFEGSLDGAAYSVCTSPTVFTGLSEGSHTFEVRAIDAAGNIDPTPATYTWTVDVTGPDTTITDAPPVITSSTSAAFEFTSDDGLATFEGSLDGAAYGACTSPAAFTGLAEGPHTFSIRAIDAIGNVDPTPATYSWTVDTTAPDTSITSTPSAISNSTSASFGFTSNEGGSTFEGSLDGAAYSVCTSPFTISGLAEGSHTFSVRAIDAAGNVDPTPADYTWAIDTTEPTIAVTGVNLSKSTLSLVENGPSATLTATVMPEDATNKNIAWDSDNPTVATVADGIVTPKASGTATITVTTEDGSKTASCTVTVSPQSSEEDATISPDWKVFYLNDPSDIVTFVSWGSAHTVTDVVYGTDHLSAPDAYTISGDELTIKEAYLLGLNLTDGDTREFEISFDIGDNAILTIEAVENGTPPTAKDPVPVQSVVAGESTSFNASDIAEDEDPIIITAIKNAPASEMATADLDNGTVTITGLSAGSTSVTVTVSDGADMVDVTVPITVTDPQTPEYALTITAGAGGSIITGSSGNYAVGTIITITATPSSGYSFNKWNSIGGGTFINAYSASTSFIMPANAAAITATFTRNDSDDDNSDNDNTPASPPKSTPTYEAVVTETGISGSTETISVNADGNSVVVDLETLGGNIFTNDGTTVITMPVIPGVSSYTMGIPASALSDPNGKGSVTLSTAVGSITIQDDMLSGLSGIDGKKTGIIIEQSDRSYLSDEVKAAIGDRPLIQLTLTLDGVQTEWNNPNSPVTVSIPYTPTADELSNPENIVVWYIDGSGNIISVPSGRYDPLTGTVTFTTTHFSSYAVAYVNKTFNDLNSAIWAKKQIQVLTAKGILRGTSEEEYAPMTNITRGEFLYFLVRTLNVDARFEGNFDDIGSDAYYYREIAIARKVGITNGTGNNKFSPDARITRQDMMVLTEKTLRIMQKLNEQGVASDLEKFADRSLIADYAAHPVACVVKEGLVEGSGGNIDPLGNTTRAEAAVILYRIYNKY